MPYYPHHRLPPPPSRHRRHTQLHVSTLRVWCVYEVLHFTFWRITIKRGQVSIACDEIGGPNFVSLSVQRSVDSHPHSNDSAPLRRLESERAECGGGAARGRILYPDAVAGAQP